MMDKSIELPPGYRFHPLDQELITFYLKPKILGQKLPCNNVVVETQLYGPNTNPWQILNPQTHPWILSEISTGKFEKVTYVFVNLTKKAVKSNNNNNGREKFIKKAGCGTWDGQTKRTQIRDFDGQLIGEKRMLSFEINEVFDQLDFSSVGHWRMHEYNLCGVYNNISNPLNTVLCKITLDSSKNPPIKLRPNKTINPSKATTGKPCKKNQKENIKDVVVDANVCSPLTISSVVVDTDFEDDGHKGEEDEINEEWVNNVYDQEKISEIERSLFEEVDTGPISFDYHWSTNNDNGYQFFAGEDDNLYLNMTYLEPRVEQRVEEFTTNLGKRKLNVATSYEMNKSNNCEKVETEVQEAVHIWALLILLR